MTDKPKKPGLPAEAPTRAADKTERRHEEIASRSAVTRASVGRAVKDRKTLARQVDTDLPEDLIPSLIARVDSFGFYNFRNAQPSPDLQKQFDDFLTENAFQIRMALLTYSQIPAEWLKANGGIPSVFETPRQYAAALYNVLVRDEFKLIVLDTPDKLSNYYKLCDLFDALRLVAKHQKEQK
jgi:hypothetical protein